MSIFVNAHVMSVWGCLRVSFEMCRGGCHCSSVSLPVKTIREQSQGGRSVKSAGEEDGWEQERMRDSKAVAGRELKNCFRRYTLCLVPRCSTWQWTQSTLMEWDGVLTMIEKKKTQLMINFPIMGYASTPKERQGLVRGHKNSLLY